MKKLMIAAAIVCAAAISQAATFNWYAGGVVDESGNAAQDYLAFGFISSSEKGGVSTWTKEAAIELVMSDSADLWNYCMPVDEQYRGGFADSGTLYLGSVVESGAKAGDNMSGFIIVVNSGDMDNYNPTMYSVIEGGTGATVNIGNADGTFTFQPATQGDWQSVPEPTSGLLLLLGVAGLALKRKRA